MQNHPIIKQIQQSGYSLKFPGFWESLNMLLEPWEYRIDECISKLSTVPAWNLL